MHKHITKSEVQQYWNYHPCGYNDARNGGFDAEIFDANARIRYRLEPEIEAFADFNAWAGKRVLEVGVGMGSDFVRFRKSGARLVGLDLSLKSVELARQNALSHQASPILLTGDSEALPFADNSFDLVYSWGVLHHTSDPPSALREVHRVLRQQGECRIMLYHRYSLLALQCYLVYGLAGGHPLSSLSELIADRIESPGTKAYSRSEVRALFGQFRQVEIRSVATSWDLRYGRRLFAPRWMVKLVPNRFGWFLLTRAVK